MLFDFVSCYGTSFFFSIFIFPQYFIHLFFCALLCYWRQRYNGCNAFFRDFCVCSIFVCKSLTSHTNTHTHTINSETLNSDTENNCWHTNIKSLLKKNKKTTCTRKKDLSKRECNQTKEFKKGILNGIFFHGIVRTQNMS